MRAALLPLALVAAFIALTTSTAEAGGVTGFNGSHDPSALRLAADQTEAPIDINSAPEDALRALPGVGPARAQAIIAPRPYKGKDDLVKKNILPKNVYDGVKDRIVARQK